MRVWLVECRDSFSYNLVAAFARAGADVRVSDVDALPDELPDADLTVLGPGPGHPEDRPSLLSLARRCAATRPVLGVCLGHQVLAVAHGGHVGRCAPVHGHPSPVTHDGTGPFDGMPQPLVVGRYHSLAVQSVPAGWRPTAYAADGVIMAMTSPDGRAIGVQVHPESVLSGSPGQRLLRAVLAHAKRCAGTMARRPG